MKRPVFQKFSELDREGVKRDFQIHTSWTDGEKSVAEIMEAAQRLGLTAIAFTEHVREDSVYFEDFFAEVDRLRKGRPLEVWAGVEAKVLSLKGNLDVSPVHHQLAEIVLGSVHRIPQDGQLVHPKELAAPELFRMEYEYSLAMIRCGHIDVLAHPAGMSLRYHGCFPQDYWQSLIKEIARTGMAFEFNAKYLNPESLPVVADLCRKYDPYISIGSDVHHVEELGRACRMMEALLW